MDYYHKYQKYKFKYLLLKTKGGMDGNLVPNLNLLRDHGTDGSFDDWKKQMAIKENDSFCIEFFNKSKKLYYIAASHTIDTESSTYRYIEYVITNLNPEIILLEGVPYEKGLSPELSYFQGEGSYAAHLAKTQNIAYSGIEGNENNILLWLSNNYKIEDIYGFLYLRMHKYYYKTANLTKQQLNEDFDKYEIPRLKLLYGEKSWDPNEWFFNTFHKKFRYGKNLEYAAPYKNTDIITQQISVDYGKIRDSMNLDNLYKFINQYNTVLYIMGQNHIYADFNVLINTFGNYQLITVNKKIDNNIH